MTTDPTADRPAPRRPRRIGLAWAVVAAIVVLVVLAACLYGVRRQIGEQVAQDFLRSRGIPTIVDIDRLGPTSLAGRLSLGPKGDPDATVDRVLVDFSVAPPWSAHPFALQVKRIRLIRPAVRATYANGRLSFGSLDRLVDEFIRKPSGAARAPSPDILVQDGTARVSTPAGMVRLTGDGELKNGSLAWVQARMAPTRLQGRDISLVVSGASLSAATGAMVTTARLDADIASFTSGGTIIQRARANLSFAGPASSLSGGAYSGRLTGSLNAQQIDQAGVSARGAVGAVTAPTLVVHVAGGRLSASGAGDIRLTAQRLLAGATAMGSAQALVRLARFEVIDGSLTSTFDGQLRSPDLNVPVAGGSARLTNIMLHLSGAADYGASGLKVSAAGSGAARAGLSRPAAARLARSVPLISSQPNYVAAIASGLSSAGITAPGLRLAIADGSTALSLTAPITASSSSGARMILSPVGGGSVVASHGRTLGGRFALAFGGGGLPAANLVLTDYTLASDHFDGAFRLKAAAAVAPAKDVTVDGMGRVRYQAGALTVEQTGCAPVTTAHFAIGSTDVQQVTARLCPSSGAPLISAGRGDWRVAARFDRTAGLAAPFEARVSEAAGTVRLAGSGRMTSAEFQVETAAVTDAQPTPRFEPMRAKGGLLLAGSRWSGTFAVATAKGQPVGAVRIAHDGVSGTGEALLDARALRFDPHGLQPGDLSPASAFAAPATGTVNFQGRYWWTAATSGSSGELSTAGLDLRSPLGAIKGVRADLHFTSLTPLVTAQGQVVTAVRIDAFAPVQAAQVRFGLATDRIHIEDGLFEVAGGQVRVEPMDALFASGTTSRGAVRLAHVDLGELIAASSMADKVQVQAVVDGRVPFETGPAGFKLVEGQVVAIKPGRVSISRAALSGVSSSPTTAAQPPNAVQDFAYQAMENLAFDHLDATLNSRPGGRLAVLFHIQGRHDPAVAQEAAIPVGDLISGKAFQKPIPLPKGTEINLTLDTSLNFDDLLKSYNDAMAAARAGSRSTRSAKVQP